MEPRTLFAFNILYTQTKRQTETQSLSEGSAAERPPTQPLGYHRSDTSRMRRLGIGESSHMVYSMRGEGKIFGEGGEEKKKQTGKKNGQRF